MLYWRWVHRPRHPLLRALIALAGAVLLIGIFVFGFFALLAFALIGSIVAITRAIARANGPLARPQQRTADARVIEGEFVVLHNDTAPFNR